MKTILTLFFLILSQISYAQSDEYDPFMDRDKKSNATAKPAIPSQIMPRDSTGRIIFTEVVTVDSTQTGPSIYIILKDFFSTNNRNFTRGNAERNSDVGNVMIGLDRGRATDNDLYFKNDQPLKLADPDQKKIIGRVVVKYTGQTIGCIHLMYIEYDLIVGVKDGRYRYQATNFNYTNINPRTNQTVQVAGWTDKGPCKSKGTLEELLNCDECNSELQKMFTFIGTDVKSLVENMNKYVRQGQVTEDKW